MFKRFCLLLISLLFALQVQASTLAVTGFETGTDGLEVVLSGGATIQTSTVRSGTYAGRCSGATASTLITVRGLDANGGIANFNVATAFYRFYFRFASLPSGTGATGIVQMIDGTDTLKGAIVIRNADDANARKLQFVDSTLDPTGVGTTALSQDTWYLIEASIATGATAAIEIKLNGTAEITDTKDTGTGNNAYIQFKNDDNANVDFFFDDVRVSDSGYPGAGVGLMAVANGDGNYTTWGTGQAGNVDERPHDSDTTFTSTSAAGTQAETFAMQNFNATGIATVKAIAIVRNSSGAANTGNLRLRSGTTDNDTTAVDPGATYVARSEIHDVDPNTTAAWTESGINGAEVGYVKTQAEAREMRMTAVYVYVDAATLSLATGTVRRSQPMFFP